MILKPKYQHGTFINLDINPRTTSFIKAGLPLDDAYLIPLAEHPWHRKATQSYCLCVELPQEKRLLIPCLELIRFYFGSPSRLFKGPLQVITFAHSWYQFSAHQIYKNTYALKRVNNLYHCEKNVFHLNSTHYINAIMFYF